MVESRRMPVISSSKATNLHVLRSPSRYSAAAAKFSLVTSTIEPHLFAVFSAESDQKISAPPLAPQGTQTVKLLRSSLLDASTNLPHLPRPLKAPTRPSTVEDMSVSPCKAVRGLPFRRFCTTRAH